MKDFTVQHNLSFSVKKLMWMLMNAQNNKYSAEIIRLTEYKNNL